MKLRVRATVARASLTGIRATTNQPVPGTEAIADNSSMPAALIVVPVPRNPPIARSCKGFTPGAGVGRSTMRGSVAATNSLSCGEISSRPPAWPIRP